MMRTIRLAYCNGVGEATMIRSASPRRVTGMVQKSLIDLRSFQPDGQRTIVFIPAVRTRQTKITPDPHARPRHT